MSRALQFVPQVSDSRVSRTPQVSAIRTDHVYVVCPAGEDAIVAAQVARELADALGAPLTVVRLASSPIPDSESDALLDHLEREGIQARVRVYLSRDGKQAAALAFQPHSLVVIAGRHRLWPTASETWRARLEAAGHCVVFVDMDARKEHARA